jgi:hypothetical protein
MPPVIGQFKGNRGEFYDQEQYKGRAIFVRYVWLNISPKSARMERSFSATAERRGDKLDLRTEQIAHGFPAPPRGRTK